MEMVEAIADAIQGEILTETAVSSLTHDPTNALPFTLTLSNSETQRAHFVVLTTPTFAMADLLAGLDTAVSDQLRSVTYNPVTTVNVAFNRSEIENPFDGFGVVVPDTESSQLLAIEGMSTKFPHRAPELVRLLNRPAMELAVLTQRAAVVGGRHGGEISNIGQHHPLRRGPPERLMVSHHHRWSQPCARSHRRRYSQRTPPVIPRTGYCG